MNVQELDRLLLHPSGREDLRGLMRCWREDRVLFRLPGMAGFAAAPSLLNKVRGAWGAVLLESGSVQVRQRRPCGWKRACAAEIFFGARPLLEVAGQVNEITKPYVLEAGRRGGDLVIVLRIFGLAGDWRREAVMAMAQALRGSVRWRDLARDGGLFVPRVVDVAEPRERRLEGLSPVAGKGEEAQLVFLAPVDAETGRLRDAPWLLFERLRVRLAMVARWHDLDLSESWGRLEEDWLGCSYEVSEVSLPARRDAGMARGGHRFRNRVDRPVRIVMAGALGNLWPLLELGRRVHVGRGASIGLGAYRLGDRSAWPV